MSDLLDVLKDVASRLDQAGVGYMISGSMALNFYGQPRMTRDIDVVAELTREGIPGALRAFEGEYYLAEEAIRAAVAERTMFNIIHLGKLVKVDIIVRKDAEYRKVEFSRRRRVELAGMSVTVVAPEDLLLSKLEWSRGGASEVQMRDARNLIVSVHGMDWDYIESWSRKLGLESLLAEARS